MPFSIGHTKKRKQRLVLDVTQKPGLKFTNSLAKIRLSSHKLNI